MGLSTWEAAPNGKIVKADVSIAKNYLSDDEMSYMEKIVSLYIDYAELQAELGRIGILRIGVVGGLDGSAVGVVRDG